MTIPIIKFDPELPTLDEFFEGHQRPEGITEGWVTINGHHVLIGDDGEKEKMVGAASHKKEFSGALTPEQSAVADKIDKQFADVWVTQGNGPLEIPKVVHDAAKELASAGFNPAILEKAPLISVEVDNEKVRREASETAAAFYNSRDKTMTLSSDVKNPVMIHEFGHHLDFSWMGTGKLAEEMGVSHGDVERTANAAISEYADVVEKIQSKLATDPRSTRTDSGFKPTKELDKELVSLSISKYAAQGGPHEWIAEGVRQYTASPRARAALQRQFPATFTYVNGLVTGNFPKTPAYGGRRFNAQGDEL
jgi:hypothetical protein